ncbi:hypothetical protein C8R46DRAFT_1109124 [Mycena filopes]|nr:hypothetical protein C8R46DRAFT_1139176 [Mycena filopes]KAJ7157078.1 hypothetical protein C8R46DRAFT_1113322 [Mycena filopes]KAJ7158414.1 hypothetical protein C8R46DRAFT_1109124 [Mycena filopes]
MSDQEEAQQLIRELRAAPKDQDIDNLDLLLIDYNQVSTQTCAELFTLLGPPQVLRIGPVPETPRRTRIARTIDRVLSQRVLFGKQRVEEAQDLDSLIRSHLVVIFRFLEAARRTSNEEFVFPDSEADILDSLKALGKAFREVEAMVRLNTDLEGTEPDTEVDPDETRVER